MYLLKWDTIFLYNSSIDLLSALLQQFGNLALFSQNFNQLDIEKIYYTKY